MGRGEGEVGGGYGAGWRGRREGASAGGFEEQPRLLWIRISLGAGGGPRGGAARANGLDGREGFGRWRRRPEGREGSLANHSTHHHLVKANKYLQDHQDFFVGLEFIFFFSFLRFSHRNFWAGIYITAYSIMQIAMTIHHEVGKKMEERKLEEGNVEKEKEINTRKSPKRRGLNLKEEVKEVKRRATGCRRGSKCKKRKQTMLKKKKMEKKISRRHETKQKTGRRIYK